MEQPLAIALDIDGTILDSAGRLSPRTSRALRRCADRGIVLYLATARPARLSLRECRSPAEVGLPSPRGAFYNGASALDRELGFCGDWPLAAPLVTQVTDFLERHAPQAQLAIQAREDYHSYRLGMDEAILSNWGFPPEERIPWEEARLQECSKVVAWSQTDSLAAVHRGLLEHFAGRLNAFLTDSGRWLQVTSEQASKATALCALLALRGLPLERVMCFGDDLPDTSMFREFGFSVAMGQSAPAVKEMACYVTATNDADGVAVALEQLVLA